jgi:hypothetical protein
MTITLRRAWLLSALPTGLRLGTRSLFTNVKGRVVRPERDLQDDERGPLKSHLQKRGLNIPGLSKSRLGFDDTYVYPDTRGRKVAHICTVLSTKSCGTLVFDIAD